jgi:type II secretion system protein H
MRTSHQHSGFTLIEILAVVLIIGFVSAMVFPNLRFTGGSNRHDEALNVASHLELARQRAIMTGKTHRVLIDVDKGSYRVEWWIRNSGGGPASTLAERQRSVWEGNSKSVLRPADNGYEYEPIPGKFGKPSLLTDPFYFDGVDTSEGWLDEGLVAVVFDSDGGTDLAQIVISEPDGFAATLDILPILDSVRIRHENDSE